MIKEVEREIEDGKKIIKNFEDASAKLENYAEKLYSEIKGALIEKYSKYNDSKDFDKKVFRELTNEIFDIIRKIRNKNLIMKMANVAFDDIDSSIYDISESDDNDDYEIRCFGRFYMEDIADGFLSRGPNYVYDFAELLLFKLLRYQVMRTMDIFQYDC